MNRPNPFVLALGVLPEQRRHPFDTDHVGAAGTRLGQAIGENGQHVARRKHYHPLLELRFLHTPDLRAEGNLVGDGVREDLVVRVLEDVADRLPEPA